MDRVTNETLHEREIRDLTETLGTKFLRVIPIIIYAAVTSIALFYGMISKKVGPVATIYASLILTAFLVPLLWIVEAQNKPNGLTATLLTGMSLCVTGLFIETTHRISRQ